MTSLSFTSPTGPNPIMIGNRPGISDSFLANLPAQQPGRTPEGFDTGAWFRNMIGGNGNGNGIGNGGMLGNLVDDIVNRVVDRLSNVLSGGANRPGGNMFQPQPAAGNMFQPPATNGANMFQPPAANGNNMFQPAQGNGSMFGANGANGTGAPTGTAPADRGYDPDVWGPSKPPSEIATPSFDDRTRVYAEIATRDGNAGSISANDLGAFLAEAGIKAAKPLVNGAVANVLERLGFSQPVADKVLQGMWELFDKLGIQAPKGQDLFNVFGSVAQNGQISPTQFNKLIDGLAQLA
ncbi:hypothetical protein [Salinarimonas sp.]|uniref:hypothetical protein n=1 Tax=Salinarimonas sp. TaxID=2766526 RepID=UPI00391C23AA